MRNIGYVDFIYNSDGERLMKTIDKGFDCGLKLIDTDGTIEGMTGLVWSGSKLSFIRYFAKDMLTGKFTSPTVAFDLLKDIITKKDEI